MTTSNTPCYFHLEKQNSYPISNQRLSGDGSVACASCHACEQGLSHGRSTSVGAFDEPLSRNSPTLWNIGYLTEFGWDGGYQSLEQVTKEMWTGAAMGAEPVTVVERLNSIDGYLQQFQKIFNSKATPENVVDAVTAFERGLISGNTAWDRWQAGDESAVGGDVKRGWEVFQSANCNICHDGFLFTDQQYHNVGIGMDGPEPDLGRFGVTGETQHRGAFKTPTLRDVARSAPYFHNGSAATLEEAVEIMAGGGFPNPHRDEMLQEVGLSPDGMQDLLAFLRSLTMECVTSEPPLPPD